MTTRTAAAAAAARSTKYVASTDKLRGKCFREPLKQAIDDFLPSANVTVLGILLRKCATSKALPEGKKVHWHISRLGLDGDTYLGNSLIQMYGRCQCLDEATAAFHGIIDRNVYTYNALLSAYAQNGHLSKASRLFETMPSWDVVSWTAMVVAHAKGGQLRKSKQFFEAIPDQDLVAWNAMVAAYVQNGYWEESIGVLACMDVEGVQPDKVTFLTLLGAFVSSDMLQTAKEVHIDLWARGFEGDLVMDTALVDMYGKCGSHQIARSVFDNMLERNVLSWTAMVTAYAQNAEPLLAEGAFETMPARNLVSFNSMLTAYAQNGYIERAKNMFECMVSRDVNSWNIMVSAYAQVGQWLESISMFKSMVVEGFRPDRVTFLGVVDSCACLQDLSYGRQVHRCIDGDFEELRREVTICNMLVSMYGKCGSLLEAENVFSFMSDKNFVSWNTMIVTKSKNGCCTEALEMFKSMHAEGIQPDSVTFTSIIFSCSHGGLYKEGLEVFVSMQADFFLDVARGHYLCFIDLLARAGQLSEAQEVAQSMPWEADDVVWNTLLSACKTQGESKLGETVGKQALTQVDEMPPSSYYVLLSSQLSVDFG